MAQSWLQSNQIVQSGGGMKVERGGVDRIEDVDLFVRIVDRGSLTSAAVSLGLSTSLVSRRLASLESSLGVRLIDRSSRMLVLTEHGRDFHARAESILLLVREAEAALRSKANELKGTLRISLPTAAAETGVLDDFVALFRKHTELTIEIRLSDRPVDVIGLGFDAALYLTDAPDRHPGDVMLAQHPTMLAASPGYLDLAGRPTSPEQLLEHRTVRAVSHRGKASEWLLMHEDGREIVLPAAGGMFLSDEVRVLYTATICGAGIGRMPLGFLANAARTGQLEPVLPEWRFRPIMIAATLRRAGVRSAKVAALLELAMGALRRIDAFASSAPSEDYYRRQLAKVSGLVKGEDKDDDSDEGRPDDIANQWKSWTL